MGEMASSAANDPVIIVTAMLGLDVLFCALGRLGFENTAVDLPPQQPSELSRDRALSSMLFTILCSCFFGVTNLPSTIVPNLSSWRLNFHFLDHRDRYLLVVHLVLPSSNGVVTLNLNSTGHTFRSCSSILCPGVWCSRLVTC